MCNLDKVEIITIDRLIIHSVLGRENASSSDNIHENKLFIMTALCERFAFYTYLIELKSLSEPLKIHLEKEELY